MAKPPPPWLLLSFKHFSHLLFLCLDGGPFLPWFSESGSCLSLHLLSPVTSDHSSSPSSPYPRPCHSASPGRLCSLTARAWPFSQADEGTAVRDGGKLSSLGPREWGLATKSM